MGLILIAAIILSFITGKVFLEHLKKKQIIQPILEDAPDNHQLKSGTPTMGGITFLVPVVIFSMLALVISDNKTFWIVILVIIFGYGLIGFRDDYLKVMKKHNESGLSPKQKLLCQLLVSVIIIIYFMQIEHATTISIFQTTIELGLLYYLLVPFLLVGFSNATNLTDGLDGLLSSIMIIIFGMILIISYNVSDMDVVILTIALIGSLIGFLIRNKYPAKMFMGDTGSLVLGALFAFLILYLKIEIIGLILALVLIWETLSVMLQVSFFKYTRKKEGEGRRIFKMAPFHHHLEKSGMSENKIVTLACCVQIVISIIVILVLI